MYKNDFRYFFLPLSYSFQTHTFFLFTFFSFDFCLITFFLFFFSLFLRFLPLHLLPSFPSISASSPSSFLLIFLFFLFLLFSILFLSSFLASSLTSFPPSSITVFSLISPSTSESKMERRNSMFACSLVGGKEVVYKLTASVNCEIVRCLFLVNEALAIHTNGNVCVWSVILEKSKQRKEKISAATILLRK